MTIGQFLIFKFSSMSGHSKWHNIQARKGKQDAARSNVFSKYSKIIGVLARNGGDPATNFSLRLAVEKAKDSGMPKENIERAIKRGTGELEGVQMEEVMYEGFGPGGVAVLVKTVTDNKNRTVSDLKHILSENGGSMAGAGSVQWMFQQLGVVVISDPPTGGRFPISNLTKDDFELTMIESGAEDISYDDGEMEIKTKVENFQKVMNKLKELNIEPSRSGIEWVAKEKVSVNAEIAERLQRLFGELEEHDDVSDYYTNAE